MTEAGNSWPGSLVGSASGPQPLFSQSADAKYPYKGEIQYVKNKNPESIVKLASLC